MKIKKAKPAHRVQHSDHTTFVNPRTSHPIRDRMDRLEKRLDRATVTYNAALNALEQKSREESKISDSLKARVNAIEKFTNAQSSLNDESFYRCEQATRYIKDEVMRLNRRIESLSEERIDARPPKDYPYKPESLIHLPQDASHV